MTFFSEERANELRNIFFESAQELLQALNEEGLLLEKCPSDPEIIRNIRRTVHTLKGDSAACGYKQLADLSHALEDVLTPEIAAHANGSLAELVLSAADIFDAMLSAYRGNMQPPAGDSLHQLIQKVASPAAVAESAEPFAPSFAWSEYERLVISQSAVRGQHVYNVALLVDPNCPMRAAALQLIRNVLQEAGTILVTHPDETSATENLELVELALATHHPQEWIAKKSKIPTVVSRVHVEEYLVATETATVEEPANEGDVLGILSELDNVADNVTSAKVHPQESEKRTDRTATAAPSAIENILRVDADRIDSVLDLLGELIIGKSMLNQVMHEFGKRFPKDQLRAQLTDALSFQAQVLNKLQRSVMKIRMVPVEQLFRRFPRVVRDLAKEQGKDIDLVLLGEATDLDKSILDALAEPLTHLVRNAVDHGLEPADQRSAVGKPAKGTIRLDAYHQGNQVVIEISDDGRGIDRAKVAAKAVEKGLITEEDAARMSDQDIFDFIFHAGLSTADHITNISGRGVGMDIVKGVIDRLKGAITIRSEVGKGTTFRLKLPLTLAIIKALLFRAAGRLYSVPLGSVLEITRAHESDIHVVDGHEVIQLRGDVLTVVRLSRLARKPIGSSSGKVFVIVVSLGDRKFGLMVDSLVGEEELVIKALDDLAVNTDLISGASILGDGTVVLILNISAVIQRLGRAARGTRERKAVGATA